MPDMAAKELKLTVFAHLGPQWAPCGQLLMTDAKMAISHSMLAPHADVEPVEGMRSAAVKTVHA